MANTPMSASLFPITELMSTAIKAAQQAGSMLVERFGSRVSVIYKQEGAYRDYPQPVSEVDIESDQAIVQIIRGAFPDHNLFTEETGWQGQKPGYNWFVDALDGTLNYLRGIPLFSVSIGLAFDQQPLLGVVFAPYYNQLFCAIAQNGAALNGTKITTSQCGDLEKAVVGSSAYRSYKISDHEAVFRSLVSSIGNLRIYASPAFELCLVGAGVFDARIVTSCEPWDVFAGALIAEEAGAKVTDWDGNHWSIGTSNMAVATPLIHEKLLDLLHA